MYLEVRSEESLSPDIFWLSGNWGHSYIWDARATSDGALLLLQGATSLTVDEKSLTQLARLHAKNATLTKVVIFEKDENPLVSDAGFFDSIGGGYFAYGMICLQLRNIYKMNLKR